MAIHSPSCFRSDYPLFVIGLANDCIIHWSVAEFSYLKVELKLN